MTTSRDRAAEILHRHHDNCNDAADALDAAGVLAPDRVPPSGTDDYAPWWFYLGDQVVGTSGHGDVGIQHTVVTHDEDGSPVRSERWIDLTPEDARHLAAILLTAAAHATQEKK